MAYLTVDRGGKYNVNPLYQWDKNQILEISGLTIPNTPEIHFVNKSMTAALVRQGEKNDKGIITVPVPNIILEKSLPIDVYICTHDGDFFRTLYALQIPVKSRQRPSDFIYESEDGILSFNALNNRLTDSIADMRDLVDNTVDTVNKKYDDTYESLVIKCDETLEQLTARCEEYLAQLKTTNDETLAALTQAFDERVENLRAEVVGDDVISLEARLKGLIAVKSNISIATSNWSNKSYTISFDKIVDGSIVDVYYNQNSKEAIADAEPSYTVGVGYITITVKNVPTSTIVIDTIKVVNDV